MFVTCSGVVMTGQTAAAVARPVTMPSCLAELRQAIAELPS